jgi:pantoate--beta-alanine ligase
MIIFKKAVTLSTFLSNSQKQVGFVPTMGALHAGHLSLVAASKSENELTACSIFVNPKQFNNPEDFKKYPVTVEHDIESLITAKCDVLFMPEESEIYPAGFQSKQFWLGKLEEVFEGLYRPGHFQGVCQVVDRLLQIVQPQNIYFGQKDYQQCMVIDKLLALTGRANSCQLKVLPTQRETDGLAMSSRNTRLNTQDRQTATAISKVLLWIKEKMSAKSFTQLEKEAIQQLVHSGFEVDYVAIVDADTLELPNDSTRKLVALVAATIHGVRLIDNMLLN